MEPILVVLLLFGAFTLGAESTGALGPEHTDPVGESQQRTTARSAAVNLQACLEGRHPALYRDLTIPFTLQQAVPSVPLEKACPDE